MQEMKPKIIRATTVPQSLSFFDTTNSELQAKYEVLLLSSPGPQLEETGNRFGMKTILISMSRHISVFKDFVSLIKIVRAFKKIKPVMVHSMTPKAGLLCMIAARLVRVPVRVHTFTGLVFPTATGLKKRVLMLTDKVTCACATHIIPEGEGVKADLINYGITKKSLSVLGYGNVKGVDLSFFDRTPEVERKASLHRKDDVFTFLYVGRIVKDKGINELSESFLRIHGNYPETQLYLVGDYENDLNPISEKARSIIDSCDSIKTVGLQKGIDLLSYYAAADCFVLPSYREGFPNTVLEAGAMGLPCIVTDINGSREIVTDSFNGLVVPPGDAEALYKAMERVLNDVELCRRMASVSRSRISERYEQGFVGRCLMDYYSKILS